MLDVDKALELLDDLIIYQYSASQSDTGDAVKMGRKAIRILAYAKGHSLSDETLNLLLNTERRQHEQSIRHKA